MTVAFGHWTLGLDGEDLPGRDLIGGKAWSVARMQSLGLNVPPAFVVTTAACKAFLAAGVEPAGLEGGDRRGDRLAGGEDRPQLRPRPASAARLGPLGRAGLDARA